jgi:cadmium resistance protein CadD (predicted permease)
MEIYLIVIVAVTAFIATNLDDIFVLIAYFAHRDFSKVSVVLGDILVFLYLYSSVALHTFSNS